MLLLLRTPAGGYGGDVSPSVVPSSQTQVGEEHPTDMDSSRHTEEVLQILESLVSAPSPSQVAPVEPTLHSGLELDMTIMQSMEGVLDLENPQLTSTQECTEDRPPAPGWPYSPMSPSTELNNSLGWVPSVERSYRPISPSEALTTTPSQGGLPLRESPPRQASQTEDSSRYGPDYALRDYLQGYRGGGTSGSQWPYSPISPNGLNPGSEYTHTLEGDRGWMDSQGTGKGKPPMGRKGINKGSGVRKGRSADTLQPIGKGVMGRGSGQVGRQEGMNDRRLAESDQPRGGEITSRPGMDPIQDIRGGDPRGRARGTPSVPPQPGRREVLIGERGDQDRPLAPVRVHPTGAQMQETPPNLPSDKSPLQMNVKDDRAPFKLFAALKPLTGKILSTPEWMQWCNRLERWTTGLSKWAFERSKMDSPKTAWKRRQGQKRRRFQGMDGGGERPQGGSGRNRTISRMANLQRNYNSSPKKCMDAIRHAPPPPRCEIPIEDVSNHYKAKLAVPQDLDLSTPLPFHLWPWSTQCDVMDPIITPEEVKRTHQAMEMDSAPGPDRIRYKSWKLIDPNREVITGILNTCRANGKIPPSWKISTTILIHKGEDPLVLDNWRPIALQNTLYKIYAAIVARRVSTWAVEKEIISPAQKGFLPKEGCLEHNHLMSSVLQDSRRRKRPAYISWLDLKDAYGSVPHAVLFHIMELAGLRGRTIKVVKDFYSQTTTSVHTKNNSTVPIKIERGVKQGCPLSPILFNLVMEVLIRAAEEVEGSGYRLANSVIKSLAYADDLCLLASTPGKMQEMLEKLFQASRWAGLSFSPRKCATLSLERSYRARQRAALQSFQLEETIIPTMSWNDRYKYLGVKVGANPTQDLDKLGSDYTKDVEAIMRSELTDWQKLDAIHRFAKPRLIYTLQNQLPTLGWAKALDKKVRTMVKVNMKLPRRTTDAFLYSPWRAGGLGLPRVEDEVHIYGISTAYRLLALSDDPVVTDVACEALGATARKRSQDTVSPQDFLNSPPQRGEGRRGDIKSLWSRVRGSRDQRQAGTRCLYP